MANLREEPEEACSNWVSTIRAEAFVNETTGQAMYETTSFSSYFNHYGFRRAAVPDDLMTNIDKIIMLECHVFAENVVMEVTAPLLGRGYSVAKP
jgi:hypothetical protein